MYILNPNQEQLDSWFKCNYQIAKHLEEKVPIIHVSDGNYYFVKTELWRTAMKELPTWIKIRELLKF